jgi:Trypsin-like peptidase domain
MSSRIFVLVWFLSLISSAGSLLGQAGGVPGNDQATTAELQHALRHLNQLSRVAAVSAPTPELRKALDQRSLPELKASFGTMASDKNLPAPSREAAKSLAGVKHLDRVSAVLAKNATSNALSSSSSGSRVALEDTTLQVQQVLTTELPAMSVGPISSSTNGLLDITACQTDTGFFPTLDSEVSRNATKIRRLADSVGRIEIKMGGDTPTLDGTGFVIDRDNGIIATACHVVYDIADRDSSSKTWTLPSERLGDSAEVLLDFGFTDAHDAQNEFRITGVAFVPTLSGCDGALLKVDTSAKPLPPALALSTSEPAASVNTNIDVFSIGYPSRDLTGATPRSNEYFTCIRKADPIAAKFAFGGEVTGVEQENGYVILTHIVPTVGGQSGSPIIQILSTGEIQVIGIHICCTQSAQVQVGAACELRDEPFLQEAVSIVDVMRLAKSSNMATLAIVKEARSNNDD